MQLRGHSCVATLTALNNAVQLVNLFTGSRMMYSIKFGKSKNYLDPIADYLELPSN